MFGGLQSPPHAARDGGPSLLSDWKMYAMGTTPTTTSSTTAQEGGMFRSALNTVTNMPGNVQTAATGGLPSRNQLLYFSIMMGAGCFFIFISLIMFLPLIVFMPAKFASCFSMGSCLVIGSFFALKGPRVQFHHMISKERLPFTIAFVGSMVGAIYSSMIIHSYLLCLFFSGIEILALLYYVLSYFPGGTAGLKFALSMLKNMILGCFRR